LKIFYLHFNSYYKITFKFFKSNFFKGLIYFLIFLKYNFHLNIKNDFIPLQELLQANDTRAGQTLGDIQYGESLLDLTSLNFVA